MKYLAELFATALKNVTANDKAKSGEQEEKEEEWCLDFSYHGLKSLFTNVYDLKTASKSHILTGCLYGFKFIFHF